MELLSHWAKGMGVWILGFLTFLAGLNALNAVVRWALEGEDRVFEPYLMGFIGKMQVATYFWVSIMAMFLFLGLTVIIAYSRPPPDPAILSRIVGIEEELATNRSVLESTQIGLYQRLEDNERAREELFNKVNITLRDVTEKTVGALEKQEQEIRKVREEQMAELATLGTRLERLERELLPKPRLTSQSNPEEIEGVDPDLGEKLRAVGVTNAGELITADPAVIAERTGASPETAMRLQAKAQLMMVPGIDENDVELLEEAGITTRRELAEQDTIELSTKIGEIAKTYVEQGKISESEKPTIEEISSWIKLAKP